MPVRAAPGNFPARMLLMAKVELYIAFEPKRGKPITLARIYDRDLLADAAFAAIEEAEEKARSTASEDEILGELHRQEVQRLRQALETVLPEIRMTGPPRVQRRQFSLDRPGLLRSEGI